MRSRNPDRQHNNGLKLITAVVAGAALVSQRTHIENQYDSRKPVVEAAWDCNVRKLCLGQLAETNPALPTVAGTVPPPVISLNPDGISNQANGGSSGSGDAGDGATAATLKTASPMLGALGPSASDAELAAVGFKEVVIPAYWTNIQPTAPTNWNDSQSLATSCNSSALGAVQRSIDAATAAGLSASLDIGVQAAPDWVFNLDGNTEFVDQSGTHFRGDPASGNAAPNAVTDPKVQQAVVAYLGCLGTLRGLGSVRLGGEDYNELRYPGGSFYFYDQASQARLPPPVRGWKPGTGTTAQATTFLNVYNKAMDDYGVFLAQAGLRAFQKNVMIEMLLPGGGERPEQIQPAENSLLTQMNGSDDIYQGLDWQHLLPMLAAVNGSHRIVAYSTWADNTDQNSPAVFIHTILPAGMLQGGESTGNGGTTPQGLADEFRYAREWGWYVANVYMNQPPDALDLGKLFKSPS
jgi:hypothetical protein